MGKDSSVIGKPLREALPELVGQPFARFKLPAAAGIGLDGTIFYSILIHKLPMSMDKSGTIIIIEDDLDDQFMLEMAFNELAYPNIRMYFTDGVSALDYLYTTPDRPFIIISDVNMPKLNGLVSP